MLVSAGLRPVPWPARGGAGVVPVDERVRRVLETALQEYRAHQDEDDYFVEAAGVAAGDLAPLVATVYAAAGPGASDATVLRVTHDVCTKLSVRERLRVPGEPFARLCRATFAELERWLPQGDDARKRDHALQDLQTLTDTQVAAIDQRLAHLQQTTQFCSECRGSNVVQEDELQRARGDEAAEFKYLCRDCGRRF